MFEIRNYCIFDISELELIDFGQVLEISSETVRKSVDGTKTFVKWNGDAPACLDLLITKGPYLTHSEILEILNTSEWSDLEFNK